MSKLSEVLQNLKKQYDLEGLKLTLSPLTGKHLGIMTEAANKDPETAYKIVFASIESNHPEITYEEVLTIPLSHIGKMAELAVDVSGLDKDAK